MSMCQYRALRVSRVQRRFWVLTRAQMVPNFHRIALSNEVFHRCSPWSTRAISAPGSTVRTLVITPPFRESWLRIMLFS